jgi:hypothetical protein
MGAGEGKRPVGMRNCHSVQSMDITQQRRPASIAIKASLIASMRPHWQQFGRPRAREAPSNIARRADSFAARQARAAWPNSGSIRASLAARRSRIPVADPTGIPVCCRIKCTSPATLAAAKARLSRARGDRFAGGSCDETAGSRRNDGVAWPGLRPRKGATHSRCLCSVAIERALYIAPEHARPMMSYLGFQRVSARQPALVIWDLELRATGSRALI